jgi:tellurite resistance protein TehA-like permease
MSEESRTSEESRLVRWIMDPLRGKTTLGRVIWWYGIVGSLVYSALGLLVDVESERAMQAYTVGGLIYSVYVTIATYRCAASMRSSFGRNFVRVSALLSLALLPLLAYLSLSGALTLTGLGGIE